MSIQLSLVVVAVALVGVISTHSVSLRSNPLHTDSEPFQLFIASAGASFDFGAGIPITRRHVLTSATLVRGYLNWNVGFGSAAISQLQYIETQVGFVHPNYNSVSFNNNVGILVMPRSFPTDLVQPIAMPNIADPSFPKLNQEGKIIGFGVINDTTMMNPSPNPTLKTVYLTVANCSGQFPGTDAVRNFCGHDDNPGATNLCRGDLGSAFVVTVRGRKVLAGISSVISSTCKPNEPISFTRAQSYLTWIAAVTTNVETF